MPGHPANFESRHIVTAIVSRFFEIHHASIIVILSREENLGKVGGMDISHGVVAGIPSSKAEVKPSDGREVVVNNNDLDQIGI